MSSPTGFADRAGILTERSATLSHAKKLIGTLLIAGAVGLAPEASAVKTSFWKSNDIDAFLEGENVSGVAIESDGTLTLGSAWDSVVTRLEGVSYIWCLARDSKGRVYFGTGDEGRIYRWTRGGGATLIWATGAPEITCMAIDASDNLYAGSAPGGTIFRVGAKGDTTRYFETGEESIWALLVGKDGAVYAGTGSKGRVYRVTAAGKGEVYAETKDVNVLSLATAKDGALLAGTASKGLLFRVERGGSQRVIYDGGGDEIRAIAVLENGSIAVAVNRGRSSRSSESPGERGGGSGSGESRYAVEVTPRAGGKCAVFLVQPDGSARLLYAPPTEYVYAMIPNDAKSVLVATGESAALFRVGVDGTYALLGVPEQKQVLALTRSGGETFAATGNDAILYSLGSKPAKEGTFTSEAYDLRSVATFGRATVASIGGEVLWSTRSGMSEEPDEGWSPWSSEVSVKASVPITSPPARFLQYRLRLKGGGAAPVVSSVEVAYLQLNLPPLLGNIQLYGPENPYMEGGPEYRPPQISQTYPNGMKVEFSYPRSGPKPVSDASVAWARGVRSVSWDAADPNGDAMKYVVSVKAEDEKEWRKLVDDYADRVYSWDSESFPNGEYRIKIDATDAPDNPPPLALSTTKVSPAFQIDNVPPRLEELRVSDLAAPRGGRPGVTVTGTAIDANSRIGEIEYSLDWGDWQSVLPLDDIFDSLEEKFRFEVKDLAPGEHSISVRASDSERNVTAAKVIAVGH